jgi:hypothetical protein
MPLPRLAALRSAGLPARLVAYGDSISEVGRNPGYSGGASAPERNWLRVLCARLAARTPGWRPQAVNWGIGGQNS